MTFIIHHNTWYKKLIVSQVIYTGNIATTRYIVHTIIHVIFTIILVPKNHTKYIGVVYLYWKIPMIAIVHDRFLISYSCMYQNMY